jgi:N6-adenosine-specific RNA methylase IME4
MMTKRYRTIVADPPWTPDLGSTWATRFTDKARPQAHYQTMSLDAIKAVAIDIPWVEQAHLWMWAINQHVDWAFETARAWGFEPVTMLTWAKPGLGVGQFQSNTEHVVLARRGSRHGNPFEATGGTWFSWPRGRHSEKPDAFFDLVEQVSPGPYLELFARRQRLGWDTWGDEALDHTNGALAGNGEARTAPAVPASPEGGAKPTGDTRGVA